jgi:hypothetical protein
MRAFSIEKYGNFVHKRDYFEIKVHFLVCEINKRPSDLPTYNQARRTKNTINANIENKLKVSKTLAFTKVSNSHAANNILLSPMTAVTPLAH